MRTATFGLVALFGVVLAVVGTSRDRGSTLAKGVPGKAFPSEVVSGKASNGMAWHVRVPK